MYEYRLSDYLNRAIQVSHLRSFPSGTSSSSFAVYLVTGLKLAPGGDERVDARLVRVQTAWIISVVNHSYSSYTDNLAFFIHSSLVPLQAGIPTTASRVNESPHGQKWIIWGRENPVFPR